MTRISVSLPTTELYNSVAAAVDPQQVEVLLWGMQSAAPAKKIDLVVVPYLDDEKLLLNLDGVETQLVQWQSIGYNDVADHLPPGHRLANAATVHETATAELAVGLMIAAQRDLPRFFKQQQQGVWFGGTTRAVADRRVTIVGHGGVGRAIAARLEAFEVQLKRVASNARTEQLADGRQVDVHGIDELPELLPETDILVLAVPLTAQTTGLISESELALLPDDALLVNVARGKVVDTAALVTELKSGRLRAALDVVDPEPLPASNPLWQLPNVLLTPHSGGDADSMQPRVAALIKRQISALLAGSEPENVVLES